MVCVLPCVLYRHVLEKTKACVQDEVGPVSHLPSSTEHATCPNVLYPGFCIWEEAATQIFQPHRNHVRHNIFVLWPPLWHFLINVKIAQNMLSWYPHIMEPELGERFICFKRNGGCIGQIVSKQVPQQGHSKYENICPYLGDMDRSVHYYINQE